MSEIVLNELFRFAEGSSVFTQTSGDIAIVYGGDTYTPYSIGRSEIETKNEMERASITLTMDYSNPVAQRYLRSPADFPVILTIFQLKNGVYTTFWKGRISKVSGNSKNKVSLTFESVFTSMRRPGLRPRYQKMCRHPLYGRRCGLQLVDWAVSVNVVDISENLIELDSVAGAPDQAYRGGMIRAPDTSLRFITSQVGVNLTLSRDYSSLRDVFIAGGSIPLGVTIYEGCAHDPTACKAKNNYINYGGFERIPNKNPMNGNAIV